MKRKVLSFILTIVMVAAFVPAVLAESGAAGGFDNFVKVNTYKSGQFPDVDSSEWYYESVKAAYEYGLMKGNADGTFNVGGNVTIAETLALACRLSDYYYGGDGSFAQGEPWYQTYVNYAVNNGIISANDYPSYEATATRAQFAAILARALPEEGYAPINSITKIPDVSLNESYYYNVLKLYEAGILTGSDAKGTFKPNSNILRTEVAAIVTRIADPGLRKEFSFEVGPFDEVAGYYLSDNDDSLYIDEDGNVEISIIRLTTLEGKASEVSKGILPITAIDANGETMKLEFIIETGELIVVGSNWNYLPAGETIAFSKVTTDLASIAGEYKSEDGDTFTIDAEGNVTISIIRLTTMEGMATGIFKGAVPITVKDANGNLMRLGFYIQTGVLAVENSTWEHLNNGESFTFEKIK